MSESSIAGIAPAGVVDGGSMPRLGGDAIRDATQMDTQADASEFGVADWLERAECAFRMGLKGAGFLDALDLSAHYDMRLTSPGVCA